MSATEKKRKLKESFHDDDSDNDQSELGDSEMRESGEQKGSQKGPLKQNHSEIEKRRRDKMNTYINELSTMIPMCNAMSRKLDKLTVLRMAVQHMRALKGRAVPFTETNYKPAFLSDEDLKNLVLEAADGFLFVVGCDRGRILYVSDSIQNSLKLTQLDLVGNSFYDHVHPRDVATLKDQLSSLEGTPRERPNTTETSKTSTSPTTKTEANKASSQMCSGARRSFFCRMKCGSKAKKAKPDEGDTTAEPCIMNRKNKMKPGSSVDKKQYVIVHFTGYLKSWPPTGYDDDDGDEDHDSGNLSCLVAVGRLVQVSDEMTDFSRPDVAKEFVSRHSSDGKFIYIDQSIASICGYLPQEMIGTSAYDYFHQDDLEVIIQSHKTALSGAMGVCSYRFLCKAGHYIPLETTSTLFRNPWTKEVEFIVCVSKVLTESDLPVKQQNMSVTVTQPSQRPILPAPTPQSMLTMQPPKRGVKQLLDALQRQQGKTPGKKGRGGGPSPLPSGEEGDSAASKAAMIGSLLAEEAKNEDASTKRQPARLGPPAPFVSTSPGTSVAGSIVGGPEIFGGSMDFNMMNPSMSSVNDPRMPSYPQSDMGSTSSASLFPPRAGSSTGIPEMSQPHLLEQLISMQHAIESMESPMQQSEETMAVFMNILEEDAGLGGEFNDLSFKNNT